MGEEILPETGYELWNDAVDTMTIPELQNAKHHYIHRIYELQKVLDLITTEMGIREHVKKFKMLCSRKGSQIALRRSMKRMAGRDTVKS